MLHSTVKHKGKTYEIRSYRRGDVVYVCPYCSGMPLWIKYSVPISTQRQLKKKIGHSLTHAIQVAADDVKRDLLDHLSRPR